MISKWMCTAIRGVHHHLDSPEIYTGMIRSNPQRANRNTHVNEKKFRRLRGQKTVILDLPDDVEMRQMKNMPPNELRLAMLKKGINPYKEVAAREWQEHQITLQSMYTVMDPYVNAEAPEASWTQPGEKFGELKEKAKHAFQSYWNGMKRIRKKEGFQDFDKKKFGSTAETIYLNAHQALMKRDKPLLHKYITEHAFRKLWPEVENGSVKFELLQFNEPSEVVSVRCADNPPHSGNHIAQITVRMHSTQKLAIYDRFGHLALGSEEKSRQILEYVVFENHVASMDGLWRLHDKVYPHWAKVKQPTMRAKLLEDQDEKGEERPTNPLHFKCNISGDMKKTAESVAEASSMARRT